MITPELAKAVLIGEYKKVVYSDGKVIACLINKYELMSKCKEWAISKNVEVSSTRHRLNDLSQHKYTANINFFRKQKNFSNETYVSNCFFSDSELQAVIDACQWILENCHE